MTEVNTVMTLKSLEARKDNPRNKPGDLEIKLIPQIDLSENKKHHIAFDHFSGYASWYTIRSENENDKLVISRDSGNTWGTITFPAGIYDYDDLNEFLKTKVNDGIVLSYDPSAFKVFVKLKKGFQIDFLRAGIFHVLLGFEKTKLTASGFSPDLPNISNSLGNTYLRCSILSDSIVSGKRTNVLYLFSTSTKKSLPFEIQPHNYLWNRINTKTITEARFFMTDDEDREVDLNGIDVSLTLVMKKKTD